MIADSERYRVKTKTLPTAYKQMIASHGGLDTARRLIASSQAHLGFTRAWETGALHLTAEYLVVFGRGGVYQQLFTEAEVEKAKKRLFDLGLDAAHEDGL